MLLELHFPRIFWVAFVLILLVLAKKSMALNVIDFQESNKLRAVFDSGLRPWMTETDTDRCQITSSEIGLVFPTGKRISRFPVEAGWFQVFQNYSISTAHFTSPLLNVAEGVRLTKVVAAEIGISTTGLEEFSNALIPKHFPNDGIWMQTLSMENVRLDLQFIAAPEFDRICSIVHLSLTWEQPHFKDRKYWSQPMSAPDEYQEIGFAKSPDVKEPQVPTNDFEYYKALILKKNAAISKLSTGFTSTTLGAPAPSGSPAAESKTPAAHKNFIYLSGILVFAGAALITAVCARRWRLNK